MLLLEANWQSKIPFTSLPIEMNWLFLQLKSYIISYIVLSLHYRQVLCSPFALCLPLFHLSPFMLLPIGDRIYPQWALAQCQPLPFSKALLFTFRCELILCQHH